jgi:autotransporter translocation and assembly factor TamB
MGRRLGWGILWALLGVVAVVGVLTTGALESRRGQRALVEFLLDRVRGDLAGSLTVDSIRSPSLLGGAVLVGVHLDAEGGRPFLDVDSVRVRYSALRLVGVTPRIAGVTLYGPHGRITRYAGEDRPNVARLLVPGPAADSAAPAPPSTAGKAIELANVTVLDGALEILSPWEGPAGRALTVAAPGGEGRLRRIALEGLGFELTDVVLRPGGGELLSGRLADLSMDASVLDRPLRVEDVDGRLGFGGDGLRVDSATFRLPDSRFDGSLALGPGEGEGWGLRLDVRTDGPASLSDLSWLDDRIPSGRYRGRVAVTAGETIGVDLRGVSVELEASRFSVDGRVQMGSATVFRDLEIRASPLALARLKPWMAADVPLDGWLSGRVHLSGRTSALATEGRVTFVATGRGAGPTTTDFRGTLHLGADPGMTDFHALLDPLDYETLGALLPSVRLSGTGRLELDAAGRVDDGIRFTADVGHRLDAATASRILARGSLRRGAEGRWVTDVQGDLSPLALGVFGVAAPALRLAGDATGSVRAVGPLDDLRVTGALQVGGGRASLDGRFDALALGAHYRIDTRVDSVRLSDFVHTLPDPTVWTGRLVAEGSGLSADSVDARISVLAAASRVGGLHVDTVTAEVRAAGGVLTVDTLQAELGGVHVSGAGGLGLGSASRGEARIEFRTADLEGLRSVFRGDVVTVRDSLGTLDRELLRMQGVDPDTLPTAAEVAMSGSMEGALTLSGSLDLLDVRGSAIVQDGVYGMDHVGRGELVVDLRHVRSPDREGRVGLNLDGLQWKGRTFEAVTSELAVRGRSGEGTVSVTRRGEERYDVDGSVALDTLGGGEAHLAHASLAVDSLAWRLRQPATVRWDRGGVTLRDVAFTREGTDPMQVTAEGTLSRTGSSDLRVDANGLHVERLARIAQLEKLGLAGHLNLDLTVTGPAASPVIQGSFAVGEPRYGDLSLDSISGELDYRDREARVRFDAAEDGRRVFRADGTVPVELALNTEGRRVVGRPMDVTVTADSLDASVALSYLDMLEDVQGKVSGDFHIGGTLDDPEPSGVLRLEDAAWSIEALGVRHTGVQGSLTLNADRTVDVDLTSRANGTSVVNGRVTLEPVSDPKLDLSVAFRDFQAVSRRDVEGNISGQVHLGETYRKPLLTGQLTVDHGTLFLEEFARSAEVVDLTDPRFGLMVDTAALSGRPLLAGISNPFLQNLRVNVDLSVPRDSWLRSEDMNVEMGGDLIVSYDRSKRDVVLVGDLQALRGSYAVLGRRFDVQSGTVGFIGTPGINPTLDIQAMSRIRRPETTPLEVTATVSGTLMQPRVTLSTQEQGIAQSDLVSYLVFGRPSYQLATPGSGSQTAAGSVGRAATEGVVTYVTGSLATRIGTALSREIGLDYLSISPAGDVGVATGVLNSAFAGTQFELGQYIGQDVFVVLVFRTPSEQGGAATNVFGGARVEVAMTDDYSVQAFWEDRLLRSRLGGLGDLNQPRIVGVFFFGEWGY